MKAAIPSLLIASAISLVLQTSYRVTEAVGVGEIGLALFIMFAIASCFATPSRTPSLGTHPLPVLALLYFLVIVLPVTALNTHYGTFGSEIRDLVAYLLCAFTIFALATQEARIREISVLTVGITIALVSLQYVAGSDNVWYSATRFTGGAKNPNQLALYAVCLILIAAVHIQGVLLKTLAIGMLVTFGLASQSDAFFAYLVATLGILLLTLIIPSRYFLIAAPLIMLLLVFGLWFLGDITSTLGTQWVQADEGGSRFTLYRNGLKAWLNNPLTFVLGNGAGNFSGIYAPFQGSEAHNTPIDILSVGGLLGLVAIYFFPIKSALAIYQLDHKIIFACTIGLILFSLFHFVARHPIFWFAIFVLFQHIKVQKGAVKACAV